MELWVRSQDKENFGKVEGLRLEYYEDGKFYIMAYGRITFTAGTYKSKERALEILDEIQNLLKPKAIIQTIDKDAGIGDLVGKPQLKEQSEIIPLSNNIVYEMPEE